MEWYEKVAQHIQDNIEDFYKQFYDVSFRKVGSDYRLEPCPKCGHKDCCAVGDAVHCFSCGWSDTHINSFIDYMINIKGESKGKAIKCLEDFTDLTYPRGQSKQEVEEALRQEKIQAIRNIAVEYYANILMTSSKKYNYKKGTTVKQMTPLQYQLEERKHSIETLRVFKVGFVESYLDLWSNLVNNQGFSKEEIEDAKIWFPEGTFIYTYFHPVTRDVMRMNIKNPFAVTMKHKNKDGSETEEVVKGMSTAGVKCFGFAPGFSFNKPMVSIEGENDALSVYEAGFKNVFWFGGQVAPEHFEIMNRANAPIYGCYDHDDPGEKYYVTINEELPHKDVRRIDFDAAYNDIDEYYKKCDNPVPINDLIDKARILYTEAFKIFRNGSVWSIENRLRKLEFKVTGKDRNGSIIGKAAYLENGKWTDREDDKSPNKLKAKMKPFNFYLHDAIQDYFNNDLPSKTFDELLDIYYYCSHKSQVVKALAKLAYNNRDGNYEDMINRIKIVLGDDVCDAVLKEVNDLTNIDVGDNLSNIPKIRISHYFNLRNNDAYFYYNALKPDGDSYRKLPMLLRNDKQAIRLDLLKRKDTQCMLLIDNKYELPYEVTSSVVELMEASLTQTWVMKYCNDEIPRIEFNPYKLTKRIEAEIKRFFFHTNENIYKILALYIMGTYYYELFGQFPYLFLNGAKGSGKSVLDSVLYMYCFNAKLAVNISDASLYRMIAMEGGTIILDEMENLTSKTKNADSIMASVLKGGYTRDEMVYRYNPEKNITEGFDTYSPKVISNIFGIEDIIEDRCIRVDTYRVEITKGTKMEDPKRFRQERLDYVREITSKCCLSALEYFQTLAEIYDASQFVTNNARLSQILTPIYALAAMIDLSKDGREPDPKKLGSHEGEYTKAFHDFYETSIRKTKKEIEENTPEGILKEVIRDIEFEIRDMIPSNEKHYTVTNNHKYKEPIRFNLEEGWFEVNIIHLKCFIEESMPGEAAYPKVIHKWLKTCFDFDMRDVNRKMANIGDDEDLVKEFRGNRRPKVNYYKVWFKEKPAGNTAPKFEAQSTTQDSTDMKEKFMNKFF